MVLGNINIHAQNPDFLFMVEYAIKAPSGHNTVAFQDQRK